MISYDYDAKNHLVHVRPEGIMTTQDALDYFRKILNDDIPSGATEVVHFEQLEDIQFNYAGLVQMRHAFSKVLQKHAFKKTIFVADSKVAFGMARMIQGVFSELDYPFELIEKNDLP